MALDDGRLLSCTPCQGDRKWPWMICENELRYPLHGRRRRKTLFNHIFNVNYLVIMDLASNRCVAIFGTSATIPPPIDRN